MIHQILSILSKGKLYHTLGSRGYFFLIDISRQSRVNEAQSAEEKIFFSPRRFEYRSEKNILWKPG